MAGFSYRKNIDGSSEAPTLKQVIAKNSVAFTVGDMVRHNTSGFGDIVDADEDISGILMVSRYLHSYSPFSFVM